MNKNLEGYIGNNQCAHCGKRESNFPDWFALTDRTSQPKGHTFTTGLILLSLFLLLIFF